MQPFSHQLLARLDLASALEEEADSVRNLLPPDPGWERIKAKKVQVAKFMSNQLRAGWTCSPQIIVAARKPHGVRPVPYWGVVERVTYRALAKVVVQGLPEMDRSSTAYLQFSFGPLDYARSLHRVPTTQDLFASPILDVLNPHYNFHGSPIQYVVRSDIASFYQYVDHSILSRELIIQGADYEATQRLSELLTEIQGRAFGLPQLLDGSDWLSEVYAAVVERELARRGLRAWRFNDDFLIACNSYEDTLRVIEQLDSACRSVGLVISESKTITYRFETYLSNVLFLKIDKTANTVAVEEIEEAVAEYTDIVGLDGDQAVVILNSAIVDAPEGTGINLRKASNEEIRLLRRALVGATSYTNAGAVSRVLDLIVYVPALTPAIANYLIAVSQVDNGSAATEIDRILTEASLNEWQRLWLVYCLDGSRLLGAGPEGEVRTKWVQGVRSDSPSAATRAWSTLALARSKAVDISLVDRELDSTPRALEPLLLCAIRDVSGPEDRRIIDALLNTNPIYAAIISEA